ncbi:MAG TPA: aspartate aminotransferase family protein [Planctomicrobium sp.]|nr:aspartate aminotransferase family protein [Planctomicrobium sp.]
MSQSKRSSAETVALFDKYVIPNYRRYPVSLVKGEGSHVWDAEGNRYLDLFPGWGCNILGYSPGKVIQAIQTQVSSLIHVPNTWHTEPQGEFAEALSTRGFGKAFFCNSGAEAIEGAIKLARLHTASEKYKIITFTNGFHGRTFAAVTATAQPKYHEGFGPLVPGFEYAPHNDLEAVRKLVDQETAAILIEPVQGEGGVNIPAPGFLEGLRALCDENNMLLIFDEVQTGMGRTGNWFGYQTFGVQPDIITMAKGIASGVACGAFLCRDEIAPSLRPGLHASTFGGNPLAMSAGLATVQTIEEENILENVKTQSAKFGAFFEQLKKELPIIEQVRVCGMMIGIDLSIEATPAVAKCLQRGLLINATHDTVVRLLPALNVTDADVEEGCTILAEVLREMAG